jgi:PAS domain S-box-containing protein/putative nucleotidyltransferase with HDIG domain
MNDKRGVGQEPVKDQGKSSRLRRLLPNSLSVQAKFFLVTGLILLLNCLVTALVIYQAEKRQLFERAFEQSELVMAAVEASRAYVREELRPAMYRQFGQDYFLPEAMSTSYVGRAVMERFAPLVGEYDYRRVALNARNPSYEADELEQRMIGFFAEHPDEGEWRGLLKIEGKDKFKRFRPVFFEEECLLCHGRPEDAPPSLVAIYGDRLGFGRTAGELSALVTVGVPVAATLVEAREKAISIFLVLFIGLALVFLALSFFFHRTVVINLRGLLEIFRDQEEPTQEERPDYLADLAKPGRVFHQKNELAELTAAAFKMAEDLRQKKEQLRRYNQELEQRVEERTGALRQSETALREARDHLEVRVRERTVELEKAIHDLAASETRYQELYDHAPAGYLSVRQSDGMIIQANEAALQMLGYSRAELVASTLFELFPPGEFGLARIESLFGLFSEGAQLKDQELQIRRHNGETLWISLTAEPVFDAEDQVVECRASILDISKRKEAEQQRQQLTERLQRSLVQTIQAIATTIEKRDPYTAGHQQRVAELAVAIAREMGLPEKRIEGLRLGAMIHDIGKIYVPAELLNRPGKLDEMEFNFIRTHPEVGYEIISGVDFPWPVAEMVVQHHERLDGSGYPKGMREDEIIPEARIIAVADVVEAITNFRPYRPARQLEKALEEIAQHQNTSYDPDVVAACLRLFKEKRFAWSKPAGVYDRE